MQYLLLIHSDENAMQATTPEETVRSWRPTALT